MSDEPAEEGWISVGPKHHSRKSFNHDEAHHHRRKFNESRQGGAGGRPSFSSSPKNGNGFAHRERKALRASAKEHGKHEDGNDVFEADDDKPEDGDWRTPKKTVPRRRGSNLEHPNSSAIQA